MEKITAYKAKDGAIFEREIDARTRNITNALEGSAIIAWHTSAGDRAMLARNAQLIYDILHNEGIRPSEKERP